MTACAETKGGGVGRSFVLSALAAFFIFFSLFSHLLGEEEEALVVPEYARLGEERVRELGPEGGGDAGLMPDALLVVGVFFFMSGLYGWLVGDGWVCWGSMDSGHPPLCLKTGGAVKGDARLLQKRTNKTGRTWC